MGQRGTQAEATGHCAQVNGNGGTCGGPGGDVWVVKTMVPKIYRLKKFNNLCVKNRKHASISIRARFTLDTQCCGGGAASTHGCNSLAQELEELNFLKVAKA